jgi:hypothetical protein
MVLFSCMMAVSLIKGAEYPQTVAGPAKIVTYKGAQRSGHNRVQVLNILHELLPSVIGETVTSYIGKSGKYFQHKQMTPGHEVLSMIALPGNCVATSSRDKKVYLWSITSGEKIAELCGHSGSVTALAYAPGGYLATGARDTMVKLWNLDTYTCVNTLAGHKKEISALAVQDNLLASGSQDTFVRLWNVSNGRLLKVFPSWIPRSLSGVTALTFAAPDIVAAGYFDGNIMMWNLDPLRNWNHCSWKAHDGRINVLTCKKNGQIVSASADGRVTVWDQIVGQGVGKPSYSIKWTDEALACGLGIDRSGKMIVNWYDAALAVYSRSGKILQGFENYKITLLAMFPEGGFITSTFHGTLDIWDQDVDIMS